MKIKFFKVTDLLIDIAGSVYCTRNPSSIIYHNTEMRHSRSEDILGDPDIGAPMRTPSPILLDEQGCASEDDLVATTALNDSSSSSHLQLDTYGNRSAATSPPPTPNATDQIDPEELIRDVITKNDLYRFTLFKRHYDKYVALSEKYEESRETSYYLEECYHEVKAEKDQLLVTQQELERRLKSCEVLLHDKEDELFIHLERNLGLDDEIELSKNERDACNVELERLKCEQASVLSQLQLLATHNELTRRNLERARLDAVRQATIIRAERDALEQENIVLKENLRVEQIKLGVERRRREEEISVLNHEVVTLRHAARHLRATAFHAVTSKRRKRCSVCLYAKRTLQDADEYRDEKLFKYLQTPPQDLHTWLHPVGLEQASSSSLSTKTRSPMLRDVIYIDKSSSSSDKEDDDHDEYGETVLTEISMSSTKSNPSPASRAISSDSGYIVDVIPSPVTTPSTPMSTVINGDFPTDNFSSETGNCISHFYEVGGSSCKNSESSASREIDAAKATTANSGEAIGRRPAPKIFTRSKWTSSLRRLFGRKSKTKINNDRMI